MEAKRLQANEHIVLKTLVYEILHLKRIGMQCKVCCKVHVNRLDPCFSLRTE